MDIRTIGFALLGILGGVCVCMEGSLNSLLGRHVGVLRSALAPFGTGFMAILIVVLFITGDRTGRVSEWTAAPWYSFLGGAFAAVFVAINILIIPKVGIGAALSATIVGQLAMSMAVDALGLFGLERIPISFARIIGLCCLLLGVRLMFVKPG
jgi:bacterial/archaeal transporter family-2 protein